ILPNSDRTRRSRKDNIHLSLLDFCLPKNAIWIMQRTDYFSKMHNANLDRMLDRCEETNLVMNWEKIHFMVKEGIVFGHKIYAAGIEVDRAKIDVIAKLPYPTNMKGVRSFLGHAGFYQSASITGRKVYEAGFFWPSIFKDAKDYVMRCDACQRSRNISSRSEMPQNNIQSEKLDDALRAFRIAYKTPTGCTHFRLVYGKDCHLPVEIEHKSYWVLKHCNMGLTAAAKNRFMKLNELMELRDGAYENTRIYKERTKKWHDSRLCGDKDFKVGDKSSSIEMESASKSMDKG
ncbi:reverse transcriptase domain-containing protein, partial [Tanacetum coccineum]